MSSAKFAVASGLVALALAACGSTAKPLAGAVNPAAKSRGVVDDPRISHLKCLTQDHLNAVSIGGTDIQVGSAPSGPRIAFQPTPGAAQEAQINGQVESAEVIGSALLYPNGASDNELTQIEDCLAQGVKG